MSNFDSKLDDLIKIIRGKGFLSEGRVENAMRIVKRHQFVPKESYYNAYEDKPLPTKMQQTVSQPSVVAHMTELLDVKNDHKVLEVGAGSGWQSAILSKLARDGMVYSVEKESEIAEFAKENHKGTGIKNVKIIVGDGALGLPDISPFDRILVTAACISVPEPLIEQLKEGGKIVAPVGDHMGQSLLVIQKINGEGHVVRRSIDVVFAPLMTNVPNDIREN